MTTAEYVKQLLSTYKKQNRIFTSSIDLAFQWVITGYLQDMRHLDVNYKTIDFKDNSVLVFKLDQYNDWYTQTQDKRY